MVKIRVEVCLISARGLRRTSLLKLQWYAVGWIDSDNKYCTTIDASGKANPVWKTRFSRAVDDPSEDLSLHVEVYSRDPIFLRERLFGSTTVVLKEFLDKYDVAKPVEEVGSFQLRKRNSDKPLGFVDVSIRISEEREDSAAAPYYLDASEGFNLNLNQETAYDQMAVVPPPNYFHYPPAGGAAYQPSPPPGYVPYNINFPMNMASAAGRGVGSGFGMGL